MSRPLDAGANGRGARATNTIREEYTATFSAIQCAAALAHACHVHIAEELQARRARGGPTRALCQLLPIVAYLRDRLDALAARNDGDAA
jgi:hypothetical protein